MPISTFFIQQSCDRCGGELGEERAISFFTGEVLCKYCSANEDAIREKIREQDGARRPTEKPNNTRMIR
jgi:hypothetical protein